MRKEADQHSKDSTFVRAVLFILSKNDQGFQEDIRRYALEKTKHAEERRRKTQTGNEANSQKSGLD